MVLSPSDRIKIISEVAGRLQDEGWALIDLTLRQFGQRTTDTWRGTEHDYIIEMISAASDSELQGLAHHVGFEVSEPVGGIDPPFWKDGSLRLFLSHLAKHKKFSGGLKEELEAYGISCFVAHSDIHPTTEWQDEIVTALSTAEVLVALLHDGFNESDWTDQEVGFAMGRSIPVFSVRFDQDPYGFIGRFQAFNGNKKSTTQLAKEIFDVLRTHKATERRMSEIIVTRFENSYSFQNAKANVGLLEELEYWSDGYSERIAGAVDGNSQISGSWGVAERVSRLVEKWARKSA